MCYVPASLCPGLPTAPAWCQVQTQTSNLEGFQHQPSRFLCLGAFCIIKDFQALAGGYQVISKCQHWALMNCHHLDLALPK